MESGWVINFKDGNRIALNEKAYKSLSKKLKKIQSEEHWFCLEGAINQYPGITLIIGC